jgi:deoxyhypusine monooxygenase
MEASTSKLTPSDAEYDGLAATLTNRTGSVPLANRFRALFTLRAIGSHRAIDIIGQGARVLL